LRNIDRNIAYLTSNVNKIMKRTKISPSKMSPSSDDYSMGNFEPEEKEDAVPHLPPVTASEAETVSATAN
jgi:hypothetical protein